MVREFLHFVDLAHDALNVGSRACREPEPTDAGLNLFGVEIEIALVRGWTLFRLDVREVQRLRVLLEGHRPVYLALLIERFRYFVGEWPNVALTPVAVGIFRKFWLTCLPVDAIA